MVSCEPGIEAGKFSKIRSWKAQISRAPLDGLNGGSGGHTDDSWGRSHSIPSHP